ncbi:MAG TPA: sulfotransferase [Vicinamibacterales bacterium]|nr:sulfotransferase [Vicinamibacterales bacterium]
MTSARHSFRLLMLGAMYENGGNTAHRCFDGHPQMFVYPFESQLGTRWVSDRLSSMFPAKYRWPEFALDATPQQDYDAIIDEECRVRARTPLVSKFRDRPFEFSDDERRRLYVARVARTGRTRAGNVAAFFEATFDAWQDCRRSGREQIFVGYSPVVTIDGEKILADCPGAVLLHIVRNPWSAFADTRKRPVPLCLADYALAWAINQYHALLLKERCPTRVHIVRFEDLIHDPVRSLRRVCESLGVQPVESLRVPSWNGASLQEIHPWGTIRLATPAANRAAARELSPAEQADIRARTRPYLEIFDYTDLP